MSDILGAVTPHQVLHHYFGYLDFRPGQLDVINSILQDQDTLAIMPTGGGKSICFQVPGLVLGGTTLVISPLISLMRDQVMALTHRGIHATYLNSTLTQPEQAERLHHLANGRYQFIYVAPERLTSNQFMTAITQARLSLVVIDEAHCASMWGHDFRPSYLKIAKWLSRLPQRPRVAAFTATATPSVTTDMLQHLGLVSPKVFASSFWRRNLRLWVHRCSTTNQQLILLFRVLTRHRNQAGIIYTLTRKQTETLVQMLQKWELGLKVAAYHGGLDHQVRAEVQDQFLRDELQIIVATNAFGMGVDKPNIRWVFHWHLPNTLENYYQEAGRAGRDGAVADCYLCPQPRDFSINLDFVRKTAPDRVRLDLEKLNASLAYAYHGGCLTAKILEYFGEKLTSNCHRCQFCLGWRLQGLRDERRHQKQLYLQLAQLAQRYDTHAAYILTNEQVALAAARYSYQAFTHLWQLIPGLGWGWHQWWAADMQTTNPNPPREPPVLQPATQVDV